MTTMQPKPNDLSFPDLTYEVVPARWHIRQAQESSSRGDCVDIELGRLFALHGMGVEHSASDGESEEWCELARRAVAVMVAGRRNTLCTAFFDGVEAKRRFRRTARTYPSL
jgi:hypothetical protein